MNVVILIYIFKIITYAITESMESECFFNRLKRIKRINDFPLFRHVIVCLLLSDITILDVINFSLSHTFWFSVCVLFLAVSTAIAGLLESYLKFRKYVKLTGCYNLSKDEVYRIKKFGSRNPLMPFKGIYDTSFDFISYAVMCNLYGGLFIIFSVIFLKFQNGYVDYFNTLEILTSPWLVFLHDLLAAVILLACLLQSSELQNKSTLTPEQIENTPYLENPDNYQYNRYHVFFNMLHFWFTLAMCGALATTFVVFLLTSVFKYELHYFIIMSIIMAFAFIVHSSVSQYARQINAVSKGAYIPLVIIFIFFLSITLFFKWSIVSLLVIVFCLFLGGYSFWLHKSSHLNEFNATTVIPILVILVPFLTGLVHLIL